MGLKITPALAATYEFACHSSACRPPTSGGTGGSSSGGAASGGASVANRRLKPGQRVSIKGASGKSAGTVRRDSKGNYYWESKINGSWGASGQAKSFAEGAKRVLGMEPHTTKQADLDAKARARFIARNGGSKSKPHPSDFKTVIEARTTMNKLAAIKKRSPKQEALLKAAVARSRGEGKLIPTEGD